MESFVMWVCIRWHILQNVGEVRSLAVGPPASPVKKAEMHIVVVGKTRQAQLGGVPLRLEFRWRGWAGGAGVSPRGEKRGSGSRSRSYPGVVFVIRF